MIVFDHPRSSKDAEPNLMIGFPCQQQQLKRQMAIIMVSNMFYEFNAKINLVDRCP